MRSYGGFRHASPTKRWSCGSGSMQGSLAVLADRAAARVLREPQPLAQGLFDELQRLPGEYARCDAQSA